MSKHFGDSKQIKFIKSSLSRWYQPRIHLVLTDELGDIEEVWKDCTFFQAVFISLYHKRFGWKQ